MTESDEDAGRLALGRSGGAPLQANLGGSRVLAQPGGSRLWLLNPTAAWLWDAWSAELGEGEIAAALAERFGVSAQQARADLGDLLRQWQQSGLLDPVPIRGQQAACPPVHARAGRLAGSAARWRLRLADQSVELIVIDPTLAALLAPILGHLRCPDPADGNHRLALQGRADAWRLLGEGVERGRGNRLDDALSQTLAELIELGCQGRRRLLVVHGAGIAQANRALLLIGCGGSGKTTLAAALNAAGFPLLGDDVVPVTTEGRALGIGMSLCLKAGSWPVLAEHLPGLASAAVWQRDGEPVRFVPPPGAVTYGPLPVGALLFPQFAPDHLAVVEVLAPEAALERLIAAEPYLPPLTQDRLETLVNWIAAAPAFALRYPDLEQGLRLVQAVLGRNSALA